MESSVLAGAHAQIAELNVLFLALLEALASSAPEGEVAAGICGLGCVELEQLLALDAAARTQLSAAPVALFHLPLAEPAVGDGQDPLPWTPPGPASIRHAFALTALAGAWHVARTEPAWAGVGFGLQAGQLAQLQGTSLGHLPRMAGAAAAGLRARFASEHRFWPVALGLAARAHASELRLMAAAAFHMASAERVDADGALRPPQLTLGGARGPRAARC